LMKGDTVPLRRHGDPKDIADAVVFLLKARSYCLFL